MTDVPASGPVPADGDGLAGVQIVHEELSGFEALGRVIAAVEDGVLVLDDLGVVVLANRAAHRMFHRVDRGLLGEEFGYPVPVGRTADIDVLVPGGNRSVEMRAAVTEIEGTRYRVATFRDITERLRADRQLREAVRMREEMLAVAAHELKTPVTVITGMSVSLRDQWAALDEETKLLLIDRLATRAEELQHLVVEVLKRREQDEWTAEPAVQVLATVIRRAIEPWPELAIETDISEEIVVWADGGQLVEMVGNLVDNARKYGATPIVVSAAVVGAEVEIRVRDHGPGISEDQRASIFDAGWRSTDARRSAQPGSGLGLGIVRKLVIANEGSVGYEDPGDGGGAVFVLRLPVDPIAR